MGLGRLMRAIWCERIPKKVCVLTQTVAGPLHFDDDRVVKEPIEERGGDNRIAKYLSPFREAAI